MNDIQNFKLKIAFNQFVLDGFIIVLLYKFMLFMSMLVFHSKSGIF